MVLKALALACAVLAGNASAAVTNGSFESGLTGWESIGSFGNQPASYLSTRTATNGSTSAHLQVYDRFPVVATTSQVRAFIGDAVGAGQYTGNAGTAIKQTFSLNAGDLVSFDWRFGKELPQPNRDTLPFFSLNGSQFILLNPADPSMYMRDPSDPQYFYQLPNSGLNIITSWLTINVPIPAAGDYTFAFGETGTSNFNLNDALFIDNVRISTAVPEPDSIALLGLGALGLLGARRRKSATNQKNV
jgi:hypothetical protein